MKALGLLICLVLLLAFVILFVLGYQVDQKNHKDKIDKYDKIIELLNRIDNRLFSIELDDYVRKENRKARIKNDSRSKTK